MPEYVASYMRCTYGGQILILSDLSPYYTEVSKNLIENAALSKKFSALSYTQHAVSIAQKEKSNRLCEEYAVPKQENLKRLLAVYIPECIYRKGGVDRPSKHYQLTRRGAQRFKALACAEFWRKYFEFVEEQEANGEYGNNQKRAILMDFMRLHGISIDCLETLYKNAYRNKDKVDSKKKSARK